MRRVWNSRFAAFSVVVALAIAGCETREIGKEEESLEGAELVFSDDFERDTLGPKWHRGSGENGSGEWKIEDGWLTASDIKNDPLWLDRKLPEKVRVEFDAKAMSEVGDLKVEIFGDGEEHESGYVLIFGGWDNELDVIARLDEHGDDRKTKPSAKVQKGKTYRWAVQRKNGTLQWFMDGEQFMSYEDPEPLRGSGHRYFAFNDWTAPVRFDNVEVYELN